MDNSSSSTEQSLRGDVLNHTPQKPATTSTLTWPLGRSGRCHAVTSQGFGPIPTRYVTNSILLDFYNQGSM